MVRIKTIFQTFLLQHHDHIDEHHDTLTFCRLELDLAMKSNDLKRALHCLLTMSNSGNIGHDGTGLGLNDILNLTPKKEDVVEGVHGIVKFAKELLDLIDAADATARGEKFAKELLDLIDTF
jgi:hypothetical protein